MASHAFRGRKYILSFLPRWNWNVRDGTCWYFSTETTELRDWLLRLGEMIISYSQKTFLNTRDSVFGRKSAGWCIVRSKTLLRELHGAFSNLRVRFLIVEITLTFFFTQYFTTRRVGDFTIILQFYFELYVELVLIDTMWYIRSRESSVRYSFCS